MDLDTVQDELPATQEACHVCGEANFFSEGGFFYCAQCNTQSQSARLYVDEDFVPERQVQARAQVLRKAKDKQRAHAKAGGEHFISSWEVWNMVLRHMGDRLVEIGFPEIVRTKIFQLYAAFMIHRKVILVSQTSEEAKSTVTFGEPKINLYSLYGIQRNPKSRRKVVKSKATAPKSRIKAVSNSDAGGFTGDISGGQQIDQEDAKLMGSQLRKKKSISKRKAIEQEYMTKAAEMAEVDTAFDVVVDEPSEIVKSKRPPLPKLTLTKASNKFKSLHSKSIKFNPIRRGKSIKFTREEIAAKQIFEFERFSLKTALILVFVALRQLGFPILFSDIIRLYLVGTLKFDSIHEVIEDEELKKNISKLCNTFLSLNSRIDNVPNCGRSIEHFVNYLGIKNFRYPEMKEVVPKYIDEFVLPREFECFVNILNHTFSFEDYFNDTNMQLERFKSLPEIIVLTQIIVVLKMLFGLDDYTEKFQSQFAKLVNEAMNEEVKKRGWSMEEWTELFVIEDWFGYLRRRRDLVKRELFCSSMYCPNNPPTMTKLHELLNVNSTSLDDELSTEEVEAVKSSTAVFEDMLRNLSIDSLRPEIPPLKPYRTLPLPSQSVVEQYLERYPVVGDPNYKPELFKQDFVQKRIDFIWNPKKYVKLLKMCGYSVKIVPGDAVSKCPLTFPENKDEAKVIVVFQPYKDFDDFVGTFREECSSSMKLLFGLCEDIVTGESGEKVTAANDPLFQKLVNATGDMYIKRCVGGLVPVLTRMDDSSSDADSS